MNITNPNISDIYSLTPLQEGILFHSIINERSNSEYIVQQIIKFGGQLNIEYINSALEMLFEKHEILRTIFLYEKLSSPKQIVLKHIKPQFSFYDFSLYDKQTKEKTFNELSKNEIDDGVMLSKGPLLKVIYVKYDENLYKIIWTVHHIILDGWSLLFYSVILCTIMICFLVLMGKQILYQQYWKKKNICVLLKTILIGLISKNLRK